MPDDLERLSAYLDNALSSADRSALESRLETDDALRSELESLRQTVQTLRSAPELAVPRNFTLDPAKYRRGAPWWARYQRMQLLAALGTAAAVLLITAGILFSANTATSPASSTTNTGAIAMQPTSLPSEERDKSADQATLDAAQRSAATSMTSMPTATPLPTQAEFPPTSTFFAALATTTNQAAQDSAAMMAPSETSTPSVMNAAAPQATGTAMPPALAATSAFKAATEGVATALYNPSDATNSAAESGAGSVAPVVPPTGVMIQATQATQQTDNFVQATATAAATLALFSVQSTATSASIESTAPPTSVATLPAGTPTLVGGVQSGQSMPPTLPILIIIGVPLLVFSIMLLGIVYLRSRLR